jgi:hypothetical protein
LIERLNIEKKLKGPKRLVVQKEIPEPPEQLNLSNNFNLQSSRYLKNSTVFKNPLIC